LSEAVNRAAIGLPAERRQAFLEQLVERFPTWEGETFLNKATPPAAAAPAPAATPATPAAVAPPKPDKPETLVEKLCKLAPTIPPAQKEELIRRLAEAGLEQPHAPAATGGPAAGAAPSGDAGSSSTVEAAMAPIRTRLQIAKLQRIDPTRMTEMFDELLALALSIEQVAWGTWRQLGPNSTVRRPQQPLKDVVRAYLQGDAGVSKPRVITDVQALRKFVASAISTLAEMPASFAAGHAEPLNPEQIQRAAEAGGEIPMMGSRMETACWRHVSKKMAPQLDAAGLQREMTQMLVQWVEKFHGAKG
jgi:hypothetical protein